MDYKYKLGNKQFPVKANDAGRYLAQIHNDYGEISPKLLVDKARDENNILHNCFEWNDGIAAEQYRMTQAALLIRCIVVVSDKKEDETRAFVSVPLSEVEQRSYHTVNVVMENDFAKSQLLKQAERDIIAFQQKYKTLKELSGILKAMTKYSSSSHS